jgi:hypothetical protein
MVFTQSSGQAQRDPANFSVDGFGITNAMRPPAKLHEIASSGRAPNSVRFFDDWDGREKLEVKNVDAITQLNEIGLEWAYNKGQTNVAKMITSLKRFKTIDEATGEAIYLDIEVRGKMDKSSVNKPIHGKDSILVITHPSLKRGADPNALTCVNGKFMKKNPRPPIRFTCTFNSSVPEAWSRLAEVHPSVATRM